MKELQKQFTGIGQVKGYEFTQMKATDYAFMYEVSKSDTLHYEIFKRRENTRFNSVSYPTDKAFGVWAWTTASLERAEDIFNSIELDAILKEN